MKKTLPKSILTLITLFVIAGAGYAQAARETPEAVAKAYFAAMKEGDWAKLAGLMSPEALASVKDVFAGVIDADKKGEAARSIFGLKSGAEYAQLGETAVFERVMSFIVNSVPEMKTVLASSTTSILGKVDEGSDLTHVVFRTRIKAPDSEVDEVDLISLKKRGETWRALLTAELEELIMDLAEEMTPDSKGADKNAPEARRPARRP